MKQNDNDKLEKRLELIHDAERRRDEAIADLAKLTGVEIQGKNRPTILPSGLSLAVEIRKVFEGAGNEARMTPSEVKRELDKIYDTDLDRANIQSTMTYMRKKGQLIKAAEYGHGKFSLKIAESS